MDHAITIGDILRVAGVVAMVFAVLGIGVVVLIVMNPFRSGH